MFDLFQKWADEAAERGVLATPEKAKRLTNDTRQTELTSRLFELNVGWDCLQLVCPKCGCDCTHVQRAYALEGSDQVEGRSEFGELYGVPVGGITGYRRGCLCIEVWGECGHTFTIEMQQHKGATFISPVIGADRDVTT